MNDWLHNKLQFQPRPLLFIEDKCEDVFTFCRELATEEAYKGEFIQRCTVLLLEETGKDTEQDILELLLEFTQLQVVAGPFEQALMPVFRLLDQANDSAALTNHRQLQAIRQRYSHIAEPFLSNRFQELQPEALETDRAYKRLIKQLIRPEGLVVSDVELVQLEFTNTSNSIFSGVRAASDVCLEEIPPTRLLSVSNCKFGIRADLDMKDDGVHIGRDDVLRKKEDIRSTVEKISTAMRSRFPFLLSIHHPTLGDVCHHHVGNQDDKYLNDELDLVVWPPENGTMRVTGAAVEDERAMVEGSSRAVILSLLLQSHLKGDDKGIDYATMCDVIENAKSNPKLKEKGKHSPAQVILGLLRMLKKSTRRKVIPKGKNNAYKLGDAVKVGFISKK